MRGYWISQTAKFNKHWQSGGQGGGGGKIWPEGKSFQATEGIIAPFYGLFVNGVFTPEIDLSRLTFTSTAYNTDIAEVQNIEVKPYIPRVSDHYYLWEEEYDGQQRELSWYTHSQYGCKVWEQHYGGAAELFTIPAGVNLATYTMKLLKPTYKLYILRKPYAASGYNLSQLFDEVSGQSRVTSSGIFTDERPYGPTGIYGELGNENSDSYYVEGEWKSDYALNINSYGIQYDKAASGGLPRKAIDQTYYSGRQQVTDIYSGLWSSYLLPSSTHNMPGGEYGLGNTYFARNNIGYDYSYMYAAWYILQRLDTIDGTIVG